MSHISVNNLHSEGNINLDTGDKTRKSSVFSTAGRTSSGASVTSLAEPKKYGGFIPDLGIMSSLRAFYESLPSMPSISLPSIFGSKSDSRISRQSSSLSQVDGGSENDQLIKTEADHIADGAEQNALAAAEIASGKYYDKPELLTKEDHKKIKDLAMMVKQYSTQADTACLGKDARSAQGSFELGRDYLNDIGKLLHEKGVTLLTHQQVEARDANLANLKVPSSEGDEVWAKKAEKEKTADIPFADLKVPSSEGDEVWAKKATTQKDNEIQTTARDFVQGSIGSALGNVLELTVAKGVATEALPAAINSFKVNYNKYKGLADNGSPLRDPRFIGDVMVRGHLLKAYKDVYDNLKVLGDSSISTLKTPDEIQTIISNPRSSAEDKAAVETSFTGLRTSADAFQKKS